MQCRGELSKVALKYSALWVRDEVENAMQERTAKGGNELFGA